MNKFATNAADLGQGLTKSASAMSTAGTDLYKTLAMLTGGAEITQSAEEFGSFLRVASMRLRGKFSCPFIVKTINCAPLKTQHNNYISQSAMGSTRLRKDLQYYIVFILRDYGTYMATYMLKLFRSLQSEKR